MKYYIAGPMTGLPESNFPTFDRAKARMKKGGLDVVSPADIARQIKAKNEKATIHDYLREDLRQLSYCDAVYFLRGWENSGGARAERAVAVRLGLHLVYQPPLGELK